MINILWHRFPALASGAGLISSYAASGMRNFFGFCFSVIPAVTMVESRNPYLCIVFFDFKGFEHV
jgi:hypothetical protein